MWVNWTLAISLRSLCSLRLIFKSRLFALRLFYTHTHFVHKKRPLKLRGLLFAEEVVADLLESVDQLDLEAAVIWTGERVVVSIKDVIDSC